jgi:hypothetical protein
MPLLLDAFQALFAGHVYKHRNSTQGDRIAGHLYDDLLTLGRSAKLVQRINDQNAVVSNLNRITGRPGRRPDGTFGALVPGAGATAYPPYAVARGPIAQLEIGTEVKVLATKMIAQIDRVLGDLEKQSRILSRQNRNAVRVAIVGVNHASEYTGWEGDRSYIAKVAPAREAADVVNRVRTEVAPLYDELLILPYSATNRSPYHFAWVNATRTLHEYSSILLRVSDAYQARF